VGSRLGAIVSNQSEVIRGRKDMDDKLKALEEDYKNREIEKPEHWGGYLVEPISIEFLAGKTK
jgi:Pyridoxamine-phosphate oxidase